MPLQKQSININFGQGLDTKTDPFQLPIGKFDNLVNTVFDKGGRLEKSNGFGFLPSLPDSSSLFVTTFNGDLTAIGTSFQAYSTGIMAWVNKGPIITSELSVLSAVRNNLDQVQADSVTAPNGLVCMAYTSTTNGSDLLFFYSVFDSTTGQNIVPATALTNPDTAHGLPRVFLMEKYFIVVYAGTSSTLKYIAIPIANPSIPLPAANVSVSFSGGLSVPFDGVVLNGILYLAWNGASASGIKMAFLNSTLAISSTTNPDPAHVATRMSVTADQQYQIIWASYYDSVSSTGYTLAVNQALTLLPNFPVQIISSGSIANIASIAYSDFMIVYYETIHTDTGVPAHFISSRTVAASTGSVSPAVIIIRSLGIASKAFRINNINYFLATYSSTYQSTYFLVEASDSNQSTPYVISKLAYQIANQGYLGFSIPAVSVTGNVAQVSYLLQDLIQAANKNTNVPSGTQINGIYSQIGINLATFTIGTVPVSAEIGSNLNVSGGFIWAYDGYQGVEQGFFLYPEPPQNTATATTGGHLDAQIYYAQWTYEWSDNQGNLYRSAPSIPVIADIHTSGTSTNTLTWVVPTLRVTFKTSNPVKIVGYRWSTHQQNYYQFTSISAPILNDTTIDSITFVDTLSDASILGNNLLYTTGGVLENIGAPAVKDLTLFDDRLFYLFSENENLIGYSKQVIQDTPVELSDELTIYVAPTIGSQGSTGGLTAHAPMDDKLILFKKDAIYYINGTGPDNTGANNQYSQPVFITASVGCDNKSSIVMTPNGLQFQSDKGIWLLGRDLSTRYIGAPVERYNDLAITGAQGIPATNQDRFTSDAGTLLMYDYYYDQWGTFSNVSAVSSTLFQGLQTYINSAGQVYQETPGQYLNGSNPVLMSFRTGWINVAGIQGFQRAYFFYLLGTYLSPHKLVVQIAYDYNPSPIQQAVISPTNFSPAYGGDPLYGSSTAYGGPDSLEQWKIFFQQQKCESFQISVTETYDPSFGVVAGAGFTLSGINCVVGIKKGYKPLRGAQSVG